MLMIPDILNYLLTGRPVNEYSDATMALVCNQVEKTWEKRILTRLGIPDTILGEIVLPGEMIGPVQAQVCEELAIRALPVVAPATHDTASAVTGIPVTDASTHWAFVSTGTWSIAGVETPKPIITDKAFDAGYGNNAIADGRNMMVNYITGLWIIQQSGKSGNADAGKAISWDEIVRRSEAAGPSAAYINVDDPAFALPQADMPRVIVDYCRSEPRRRYCSPASGPSFRIETMTPGMSASAGERGIVHVDVGGGGTRRLGAPHDLVPGNGPAGVRHPLLAALLDDPEPGDVVHHHVPAVRDGVVAVAGLEGCVGHDGFRGLHAGNRPGPGRDERPAPASAPPEARSRRTRCRAWPGRRREGAGRPAPRTPAPGGARSGRRA